MSQTNEREQDEHRYTMRVDLSVLESLGINLYSNAAAVLSELVANAYDADSNEVRIAWKQGNEQVVVTDDGVGMDVSEINERFLTVGYKKRDTEGTISDKFDRLFMGRKGIGKLSVFSIAKTVFVYSTKNGESNGLKIVVADLEKAIRDRVAYHPDPVDVPPDYAKQGTTLVLTDLKTKRADLTASALIKRIARRFDVLDEREPEDGGFKIFVNDHRVSWADREELKRLEFIWEFGAQALEDKVLPNGITRYVLPDNKVTGRDDWRVTGWIGTAQKPADLTKDEEAGSLKNVIVLARKRPIQEGIIEKLDFAKLFGNYVTGQIEADFLDLDEGYDDIATSDRQRLIEDDERVVGLVKFLREAFNTAAEQWSAARPKKEAVDILGRFPELRKWVDERPPYQRDNAEKMIGTIASLDIDDDNVEDRLALFRSGVLAFERIGLRDTSTEIASLSTVTAKDLLPLLGRQDAYETALWGDILRSRVEAIQQFRDMTDENEKEVVLQTHLFDHLWLVDPSWERATKDIVMEENLRRVAPGVLAMDEEQNEITGRFDIRYRTVSGQHVLVELKRYRRNMEVGELADQGSKYFDALTSILDQQGLPTDQISVVFVLGTKPKTPQRGRLTPEEAIRDRFNAFNGRYVLYDELIGNAQRQYQQYLEASDTVKTLNELLDSLNAAALASKYGI
ncbi:MAG TPA: ATP-binding protein [Solirubrobacteraceae bacterium]|jgi:hypothetical protein